jgi:hypothetical protein
MRISDDGPPRVIGVGLLELKGCLLSQIQAGGQLKMACCIRSKRQRNFNSEFTAA